MNYGSELGYSLRKTGKWVDLRNNGNVVIGMGERGHNDAACASALTDNREDRGRSVAEMSVEEWMEG
jgi:hypothetical protein